jgi:hypothetical protein
MGWKSLMSSASEPRRKLTFADLKPIRRIPDAPPVEEKPRRVPVKANAAARVAL